MSKKDDNPWAKKKTSSETPKRGSRISLRSLRDKTSTSAPTNSPTQKPSTKANPWSGRSTPSVAPAPSRTSTSRSSRKQSQGEQLSLDLAPEPKQRPRTLPPRDDQRVVRQPWAGKTPSGAWAAHIKRARRMQREFPPGSSVTVSWRWDAASSFSTRPDAIDDSFGGVIEKYDELGQMHLHGGPRKALFVIPCGHITDIKGEQ